MTKLERQLRRKLAELNRQWLRDLTRRGNRAQLSHDLDRWVAVKRSVRHLQELGISRRKCRAAYNADLFAPEVPCSHQPF